ncbi:MAG: hypothetical protein ACTHLZ_18110, partial [Tepidisphaeraceae bacterium]
RGPFACAATQRKKRQPDRNRSIRLPLNVLALMNWAWINPVPALPALTNPPLANPEPTNPALAQSGLNDPALEGGALQCPANRFRPSA